MIAEPKAQFFSGHDVSHPSHMYKIEKQSLFFGQQGLSFNIMKRAAIKMQIEIG